MPMDRKRYPSNWDEIAKFVKAKAGWKCSECGRLCRKVGESLEKFAERCAIDSDNTCEIFTHPSRFVLTVAHLDHTPENCSPENLRALCSGCHCRYDLKAMGRKKMLKREYYGQLTLDLN